MIQSKGGARTGLFYTCLFSVFVGSASADHLRKRWYIRSVNQNQSMRFNESALRQIARLSEAEKEGKLSYRAPKEGRAS